jgi:hypothetical protein
LTEDVGGRARGRRTTIRRVGFIVGVVVVLLGVLIASLIAAAQDSGSDGWLDREIGAALGGTPVVGAESAERVLEVKSHDTDRPAVFVQVPDGWEGHRPGRTAAGVTSLVAVLAPAKAPASRRILVLPGGPGVRDTAALTQQVLADVNRDLEGVRVTGAPVSVHEGRGRTTAEFTFDNHGGAWSARILTVNAPELPAAFVLIGTPDDVVAAHDRLDAVVMSASPAADLTAARLDEPRRMKLTSSLLKTPLSVLVPTAWEGELTGDKPDNGGPHVAYFEGPVSEYEDPPIVLVSVTEPTDFTPVTFVKTRSSGVRLWGSAGCPPRRVRGPAVLRLVRPVPSALAKPAVPALGEFERPSATCASRSTPGSLAFE